MILCRDPEQLQQPGQPEICGRGSRIRSGCRFRQPGRGNRRSEQLEGQTDRETATGGRNRPNQGICRGVFPEISQGGSRIHQLMICIRIRSRVPEQLRGDPLPGSIS